MRWKYANRSRPGEIEHREQTEKHIDQWWSAFLEHAEAIASSVSRSDGFDIPRFMHQHLTPIAPHLQWEFASQPAGSGHRLTITPESRYHLRPLVETLLERAPSLESWLFLTHRPPETLDWARANVENRTGRPLLDFQVRIRRGRFHRIDLRYAVAAEIDREVAWEQAFLVSETLLGEETLDRWVGTIDLADPADIERGLIDLERLRPTATALVGSILDQLPQRTCLDRAEVEQWRTLERKIPDDTEDYPRRSDLCVGATMLPDLWTGSVSGALLPDERFSRVGEVFCYLKIERTEAFEDSELASRERLQEFFRTALGPTGAVIGSGTGHRYRYVDLALIDREAALKNLREVLLDESLPRRTWLLFFDAYLDAEWIGFDDATPPPPEEPSNHPESQS